MGDLPAEFIAALDRRTDTELFLRDLDGLVAKREGVTCASSHGFQSQTAAEYFVRGLQRYRSRQDSFTDELGYRYLVDYALMPLLACWRHEAFREEVEELFEFFLQLLSGTPYADENEIYREALEYARRGHDYSDLWLPKVLEMRLLNLHRWSTQGVADVRAFWEKLRSPANIQLANEFREIFHGLPPGRVTDVVSAVIGDLVIDLGTREGFRFTSEDYRRAVVEALDAQPEGARELADTYRTMVAEGRWFEVVDGVVFGG